MNAPAINLDLSGIAAIAAIGLLLTLGLVAYQKRQAIGAALDPTADTNLAYRGASALTQAITGDGSSFGQKIWEWTHPGAVKAEAPRPSSPAAPASDDLSTYYGL